MKKILFIDTGKEYGGGTKSFLYLLQELLKDQELDIYVHFEYDYAYSGTTISKAIHAMGAKFIYSEPKKKLTKFKKELFRAISKKLLRSIQYKINFEYASNLLRKNNYDIVHLNNHFSENLYYIEAANQLKMKVIQHLRKNSPVESEKLEKLRQLSFTPISVSKSTYNYYNAILPIDQNIIYNPVIMPPMEISSSPQDTINILMPANFLSLKGHALVFKAFLDITRKDLRLLLAGDGTFEGEPLKNYTLLKQKGILIDLGFVTNIEDFYLSSDYVLNFSENEGLPRAVLEGLSLGCGIIASDIPIEKELYDICENKNNFYIIPRNPTALLELLNHIKPIQEKKKDLNIIETFSIQHYVDSVKNLYKALL
ncbi:glycosyltransferase family 4 protein [Sulfurospirillum arsenophilum]|uniref:glycosyltransferase family 4 protein n=1 Tax=Sulfurospirillum arsenophilum TaxID=56698 RepID=UPI0005A8D2BD|nr:glycosyltransferase family 4 protein [Sulfurospirillum arsenophilum]